jgi:hypothetical protein
MNKYISEYKIKKSKELKILLGYLDVVPSFYKTGNWCWSAHVVLFIFSSFILLTIPQAMKSYNRYNNYVSNSEIVSEWIQAYRLIVGLYCVIILCLIIKKSGIWPLASYTVLSWNLVILRLLLSYINNTNYFIDLNLEILTFITNSLLFPSLVGCSITVIVWWLLLFPTILYLIRHDTKKINYFWDFNTSFVLINIHLLNLPIIAIEFISVGKV